MLVSHQSIETPATSKMFKFVVLCAFVASAVAEANPDLLASPYVQPYAAYSTVVSPGLTSISSQSSSVIHPSPYAYSAPWAFPHLIKKRSAQLLATPYSAAYNYYPYSVPASTYLASSPFVHSPISYNAASLPIAAHLIKKRSAPLLTSPYFASTAYLANPAISSPLISTPYIQTPYYGANLPLVNAHFIKKRSAEPVAEPAAAPAADPQTYISSGYYAQTPYYNNVLNTPYFANPLIPNYYSASGLTTHLIKKRSAEPVAEPAAEPAAAPAADPLTFISSYQTPYFGGSPLIPTVYNSNLVNTPLISTNPYIYSSYIKK